MTENEGELYKKLKPFAERLEGEIGTLNGDDGCVVEIEMILDEAKQDFPTLKLIEVSIEQPMITNTDFAETLTKLQIERNLREKEMQRQAENNAVKYIQETQKWFEKWFGEASLNQK